MYKLKISTEVSIDNIVKRPSTHMDRQTDRVIKAHTRVMYNVPHAAKRSCTNPVVQCKLECGPMPNVMAALLNIGGAL